MTSPLVQRLGEVAAIQPQKTAIHDGTASITYQGLVELTAAIAARLHECGVEEGELVAVLVDRSTASVVAVLGVLAAGAAYVPLNAGDPQSRRDAIVKDARTRFLITLGSTADPAAMRIEQVRAPSEEPAERFPGLAYVIYTSGSTGLPKGCLIGTDGVVEMLRQASQLCDIGRDDVWTLAHSLAFDFSVWEVWGALLSGATLEVLAADVLMEPVRFRAELDERAVTVFSGVPTLARHLLHDLTSADLPRLRCVILGGEQVRIADFATVLQKRPALQIFNMYGITEITVHATCKLLAAADLRGDAASPIGRPMPSFEWKVCDEDGGRCAPGISGELWLAGPSLARGYLRRPELTAARFPQDKDGRRWYRSGDEVVELPDGELDFVGRLDDQLKVRGYRVEVGEIEAALRSTPGVKDAVVVERTSSAGISTLVALWTPSSATVQLEPAALRQHLQSVLPKYMLPARFKRVESLATTPSGKVDRQAARAVVEQRTSRRRSGR